MPIGSRQEFAPDSYWESVKSRMGELRDMPGNAIRSTMERIGNGAPMNPNVRPSAVENPDALPASGDGVTDPLQRQQMIDALIRARQQQQQMPQQGQGQPGVDQRQLILQEAQRRGIPVPPDSPLLQGGGGQTSPDNPAGIQF